MIGFSERTGHSHREMEMVILVNTGDWKSVSDVNEGWRAQAWRRRMSPIRWEEVGGRRDDQEASILPSTFRFEKGGKLTVGVKEQLERNINLKQCIGTSLSLFHECLYKRHFFRSSAASAFSSVMAWLKQSRSIPRELSMYMVI